MQFTTFVVSAVAATGAVALQPRALTTGSWSNSTTTTTAWVTQTVTAYETYCPKKTTWTHTNGGKTKTYTGSKKQWVTVTDCPTAGCTISNQVGHKPTVVPVGYNPKYQNGTVPATPTAIPTPVYTPCPCSSSSATVIINNYNNGTTYGTAGNSGSSGLASTKGSNSPASTKGSNSPASTKGSNSPASTKGSNSPASTGTGSSSTSASTNSCQCPVPNKNSGNTGSSNSANNGSGSSNSGSTGSSNGANTGSGSSNSGNTGSGSTGSGSGSGSGSSSGSGSGSGSGSSGNRTSGPQQVTNGAGKALIGQAVTGLVGLAVAALIL